jgi:origin recognition complex subunit 1
LQNELYITPETDVNPLTSINGTATILSPAAFNKKYPNGKIPRRSKEYGKTYICRRGCDTRTIIYTQEFVWEDISRQNENDMLGLLDRLETETQSNSTKKRKLEKRKRGDEEFTGGHLNEEELEAETPRKKQKIAGVSTPRKPRTPSKLVTPSHKR